MGGVRKWFSLWPSAWRRRAFRPRAILTLLLFSGVTTALVFFLQWVERRPGVVIADPVLNLVGPVDLTWLIFGLIYLSLVVGLAALSREPERLLLAMLTYAFVSLFRMAGMYLLPLDPPLTTIPLQDPFVQLFGSGEIPMRDLFFSGHTSTLMILALTAAPRLRIPFIVGTILVALSVILHHTHYAVDVLVAPFATYTAYQCALFLTKRLDPESNIS